jgi:hypothetical protein
MRGEHYSSVSRHRAEHPLALLVPPLPKTRLLWPSREGLIFPT